jgi:hypothetical protein
MTANLKKSKDFQKALHRNLQKVQKGDAEVLDHSFVEVSEKTIMKEIQMIKVLRPDLQKFFYDTSVNFPPNENVSGETMLQISLNYLREGGFNQHQYIIFRHHDLDYPQLCILVNRIGYDGTLVSDSFDFARCDMLLRYLEKKYNLTRGISSRLTKNR